MWRDYKIFKQNCHYELNGEEVDYWDLTNEEQECAEIKDDDTVFVEEFEAPTEEEAYKYFKQNYGGDDEHPSYYILERADRKYFEHGGDLKRLFSDSYDWYGSR